MAINTLFQLYSMKQHQDAQLEVARQLLFMPDLFSYFLTGVANNEYCIASTSELLNAKSRNWSFDTIHSLGLPEHLFGKIILPGTIRGTLKEDIARETGLGAVDVIAVGSHDTASAVAAVPAAESPIAFLSSGTWSLLGVEVDEPILTEEARKVGVELAKQALLQNEICAAEDEKRKLPSLRRRNDRIFTGKRAWRTKSGTCLCGHERNSWKG